MQGENNVNDRNVTTIQVSYRWLKMTWNIPTGRWNDERSEATCELRQGEKLTIEGFRHIEVAEVTAECVRFAIASFPCGEPLCPGGQCLFENDIDGVEYQLIFYWNR